MSYITKPVTSNFPSASYNASASYNVSGSKASASYAANASRNPVQTQAQKDEQHLKDVADGVNNPVSWYHWNKEVPLMDSKAAWQDDQYQTWRNAQVQKSGSYKDGRFTGGTPYTGSYPVTASYSTGSGFINQQPQTQQPHMPKDNWAAR